jgi:hypothetical protein
MFEAVLTDEARAFYEHLTMSKREDLDRILHALEADPSGSAETTALATLGGIGFGVYDDGHWEVMFRVLDDRFIEVVGISRITD